VVVVAGIFGFPPMRQTGASGAAKVVSVRMVARLKLISAP
jgi:hypothetical protein